MLKSFRNYGIFLIIAIFIGSVLLSNKAGVNLQHHHNLPQITQSEKVYCTGYFSKKCAVRLTTTIKEPEVYREVLKVLTEAKSGDVIVFYLAGNGGRVDATKQIMYAMQQSKATVIAVVEGDVYSAHAFLALAADKLIINNLAVMMMHRSSAYGAESNCDKFKGKTDRTQDAHQKCLTYLKYHLLTDEATVRILMKKHFTKEEIERVLKGEDIYLTGYEINKKTRLKLK